MITEAGGSRAKCEMKGPAKTGDPEDQVLTARGK